MNEDKNNWIAPLVNSGAPLYDPKDFKSVLKGEVA